ncbi:MAG: hypothetical protein B0D92_00175 [Spirochaeta sp. LUC14_002_19_P3]|nr:MAG: hypothetical protein B0D92_00175 [Spirochaeta sp. LUC14_002_19_P3]
MTTVFLFPGQGAQFPGMGKDFYEADSGVRKLFEEASDVGGKNWAKILFEGTAEELKATDVAQIAIVLVSIAASMALKARGIDASACAGFSLGEYSALYQAGVLSRGDLLRVIDKRGELLERISRTKDDADGPAGMMAVLGLDAETIAQEIQGLENVYAAIHSSPAQTVLAGTAAGLSAAEKVLDKAGAMRLVRLRVSGPFHSPLLSDARDEFAEVLRNTNFADPKIPIVVNTTATPPLSGDALRKTCVDQLDNRVRWVECQNALMAMEPQRVLEAGPGQVLCGLWKTMKYGLRAHPAGTLEAIEGLL